MAARIGDFDRIRQTAIGLAALLVMLLKLVKASGGGGGQALTVDETCFYRDWADSRYTPNNFTAVGNPSESDT